MKKLVVITLAVCAMLLTSCATKPIAGKGVKNKAKKAELLDYKGAELGRDLPAWVLDSFDGNEKALAKDLSLDVKEWKVWVVNGRGTNYEFLKEWIDQVDGRGQIASGIKQSIGDGINAGTKMTPEDQEKAVNRVSERLTSQTLVGLEKITDCWTLTQLGKETPIYTYYVAYKMPRDVWDKTLEAALNDVDTFGDQAETLRNVITNKLEEFVAVPATENGF